MTGRTSKVPSREPNTYFLILKFKKLHQEVMALGNL